MAHYTQAQRQSIYPKIRELLKTYGIRGRLGVRHRSCVELRISEGCLDFLGDCVHAGPGIKHGYIHGAKASYFKNKKIIKFISEAHAILNEGNHNNNDLQTDYFDVGWYTSIDIGDYNKPYKLIEA